MNRIFYWPEIDINFYFLSSFNKKLQKSDTSGVEEVTGLQGQTIRKKLNACTEVLAIQKQKGVLGKNIYVQIFHISEIFFYFVKNVGYVTLILFFSNSKISINFVLYFSADVPVMTARSG